MGRIIKNLRAFARQESERMSDVDLVAVVDGGARTDRGAAAGPRRVRVDWTPPARPVWVRGGEVRLQQVVVNLISNAVDAMAGRRTVTIAHRPSRHAAGSGSDGRAIPGPGIAEPERIFDPFYSTKEVGASEGMGLGLSISYGIVQSFGGTIPGGNRSRRRGGLHRRAGGGGAGAKAA